MDEITEQFYTVFSNDGHYQWANNYKKQYLYALRESLDNATDELPDNLVSKKTNEIYEIVKKYDNDFTLFKKFQKISNYFQKKLLRFIKFLFLKMTLIIFQLFLTKNILWRQMMNGQILE